MANTRFPSSSSKSNSNSTESNAISLPFQSTIAGIAKEISNITRGVENQLAAIQNHFKTLAKHRADAKREKEKEKKKSDKEHVSLSTLLKDSLGYIGKQIQTVGGNIYGSLKNFSYSLKSGIGSALSSALSAIFGDSPVAKILTSPVTLAIIGIYAAVQWIMKKLGFKEKERKETVRKISYIPESERTEEEQAIIEKDTKLEADKAKVKEATERAAEEQKKLSFWDWKDGLFKKTDPQLSSKNLMKLSRDITARNKAIDTYTKKKETEAKEAAARAKDKKKSEATANVAATNANVNNNNVTNNTTIINHVASKKSNAVTNKR